MKLIDYLFFDEQPRKLAKYHTENNVEIILKNIGLGNIFVCMVFLANEIQFMCLCANQQQSSYYDILYKYFANKKKTLHVVILY